MWFEYSVDAQAKATLQGGPLLEQAILRKPDKVFWQKFWAQITKQGMGDFKTNWVPETLNAIYPLQFLRIESDTIPATRTIYSFFGKDRSDQFDASASATS